MTALELRILAYGIMALVLIGGSGFGGYTLAAHHYQRLMAADQIAQANAVIAAQEKTAAVLASQQAASVAAEKQYEDLKSSAATLGDELTSSLRQYSALHRAILSATAKASTGAHAAPEGAGGDPGLETLAGSAATACLGDAAELQSLQSWAESISKVTP